MVKRGMKVKRDRNRARTMRSSLRRGRRAANRRARRLDYVRLRNELRRFAFATPTRERSAEAAQTAHDFVMAPEVLSLRQNPEPVIRFIATLRTHYERREAVFVDLREVTKIEIDGIAVLLSVLVKFKSAGVRFTGNYPADPAARLALEKSRFFEMLYHEKFRNQRSYNLETGGSISTHAKHQVDGPLAGKIVEAASRFIWGEPRRCRGVYRAIQELMLNTHNHAVPLKEGGRQWWLATKHVQSERRVAFSFIDYGVGIFESLRRATHPLRAVIDRLSLGDDTAVLKAIFEGRIQKTSSGDYFRGKGLRGIHAAMKQRDLSQFVLISNRVMFDGVADEFRLLEVSLQGTFVYWEIDSTNRSVR